MLHLVAWAMLLGGPGAAFAAPAIDTAQASGVAGYPIGIFGSGFGASAGRVTIRGVEAAIIRWSDSAIEASIPSVADGSGDLAVETPGGTARRPFVVYSIDPRFLASPTVLENIIYRKPAVITGAYTQWGAGAATDFLTYNDGGGAADLEVPSAVAVNLGQAVQGPVWWSFYGSGNWYEYPEDNPRSYVIEGSADSTTGQDGTWAALLTIAGNDRSARTHRVELSGHRWIRMRVTATTGGRTFRLREVRAFRPRAGDLARLDSLAVFGDSITHIDLEGTGKNAFYQVLRDLKADGTQPVTHVMGMVGQNTLVLTREAASSEPHRSLARAMALQPEVRYWGIALGTNDTNSSGVFASYRDNLVQGIDQLLAAGKVPVLARIPDTAPGGYGTPERKKEALSIIDELSALYRLIPGPDFYTPFRLNLSTYISDGTHHTAEGARVVNRLWAETIVRSGIYGARGLGRSNVLWHHQGTGSLYLWTMNGPAQTGGTPLSPGGVSNTQWQVRGTADFGGDGKNDILWQHQGTGELYGWTMNGATQTAGAYLSPAQVSDTQWQIRGLADFSGDGKPDVLWQHQGTGDLYLWAMNGTTRTGGASLSPARVVDTQWRVVGVGDFNGDAKADLLWHHQGTGDVYVWFMNGLVQAGGASLGRVSSLQWQIRQVGDFSADGKPDILWHHQTAGTLYAWYLNGTARAGESYLSPSAVTDTSWKVAQR